MQNPAAARQYTILLLGHKESGRLALIERFVKGRFSERCYFAVEDQWRKMVNIDGEVALLDIWKADGDSNFAGAEFFIVCHSYLSNELNETAALFQQIRRVKGIAADVRVLPVFLAACKADHINEPNCLTRKQLVAFAAQNGAAGFYETSGMLGVNVEALFYDAVRYVRRQEAGKREANAKAEITKLSGAAGLLPWNWRKKIEWNQRLKRLEFEAQSTRAVSSEGLVSTDVECDQFTFPEPAMQKNPVAFYEDIATLLTSEEGKRCADVYLVPETSGTKQRAHRIVLCLRCQRLRDLLKHVAHGATVEVPGVASDAVLTEVLRFFYANEVRDGLSKELLHELSQVSNALSSPELRAAASAALAKQGAKAPRAIESSEMVQREMRPALSELRDLADVTVRVEKQPFRLHRAILVARCKWLAVLLAERWRGGGAEAVEVTSMSADVFAVVVEFLYTGRARITDELAIDVLGAADLLGLHRLTQLAEMALQPAIDSGNAPSVYLAAVHCRAAQLQRTCLYWMATEYEKAQLHEQWAALLAEVQASVRAEHELLVAKRAELRATRQLLQQLPCVLYAPPTPTNP